MMPNDFGKKGKTVRFDGRGRWYRWQKKDLVTDYLELDIRTIAKRVDLSRSVSVVLTWHRQQERYASLYLTVLPNRGLKLCYSVNGRSVAPYIVDITATQPHFGGAHWWFRCPGSGCGRRCAILYGGEHFLCRHCWNLTYETAQSGGNKRVTIDNRLRAIRHRLHEYGGGILDPLPDRPRYMHHRTYWKLMIEYLHLQELRQKFLDLELRSIAEVTQDIEDVGCYRRAMNASWSEFRSGKRTPSVPWLSCDQPADSTPHPPVERLTLGQLAGKANVPVEFAKEAVHAGLLRPDAGREGRIRRYRPRLSHWLSKLYALRDAGMSWAAIQEWTKRRWLSDHEHERRWPQGVERFRASGSKDKS